MRNLKRLVKTLWQFDPYYVILNCLLSLENIPRKLLNVLVIQMVVNYATQGIFTSVLYVSALFFFYLLLTSIMRNFIRESYNVKAEDSIREKIRNSAYAIARELDLSNFDNSEFYDKSARALDQLDEKLINAFKSFIEIFSAAVSAITLASTITVLSPPLMIVIITACIISTILSSAKSKISIEKYKTLTPIRRRIDYISELFFKPEYAKDIRVESLPDLALDEHKSNSERLLGEDKRFAKKISRLSIATESIGDLSDILMWCFLGWGIVTGSLNAGDFMALSNASWSFSQNFRKLFNKIPKFKESCVYANMLDELSNCPQRSRSGLKPPKKAEQITVSNISFTYPGNSLATLNNISFTLRKGEATAIVGHNGAGKTTIAKLLSALYLPSNGNIAIDGTPYTQLSTVVLQQDTAWVFQDHQHYEFTIAEDILMHTVNNEEDISTVRSALAKVGMLDKVESLSKGIHTQMTKKYSSNGAVFSGGELQKLALARAVAKDAQIVILDEPSSSLDPLSEAEIEQMIYRLFPDKIVVIISHRLAMTKNADNIIVLDKGSICEQGRHNELVCKAGLYAKLWNAQASNY